MALQTLRQLPWRYRRQTSTHSSLQLGRIALYPAQIRILKPSVDEDWYFSSRLNFRDQLSHAPTITLLAAVITESTVISSMQRPFSG